jgi:hypothetical protein
MVPPLYLRLLDFYEAQDMSAAGIPPFGKPGHIDSDFCKKLE